MNTSTLKLWIVSILLTLSVISCGGGEDGGPSTAPPDRAIGTISGVVFDAPVSGASVSIWEYKNGKVGRMLGQTLSDPQGNYSVNITSASIPMFVKAEGGAYRDPVTQEVISVSNGKTISMSGVFNYVEGAQQKLMITPLTHKVAGLTQFRIARGAEAGSAIQNAITAVSNLYGFDVNITTPIDISKGGQSSYASSGHKYGALLTAYSSYSKDLIDLYPAEESKTLYTAMHISDLQYRDIKADGVLNGVEIDGFGIEKAITFGRAAINSDFYTSTLAQHILISVNNPLLNVSGTEASEYESFSDHLNKLGTTGDSGGLIPPRDEIPLDSDSPVVTREGKEVLSGDGEISLQFTDEIGVKGVEVYIEYQTTESTWSEALLCDENAENGLCAIDSSDFVVGVRETTAKVLIDTQALDKLVPPPEEEQPTVLAARLTVYAEDALGNKPHYGAGTKLPFQWDNISPVIVVTSPSTMNGTAEVYELTGYIVDSGSEIASATITMGDDIRSLECFSSGSDILPTCRFSETYTDTTAFGNATRFVIEAVDEQGNTSERIFEVTRDNTRPTQSLEFPSATATKMMYINIDADNNRSEDYIDDYALQTFNEGNIDSTLKNLKVNFAYARAGLVATHPSVEYDDFAKSIGLLRENFVPFVKVRVADAHDEAANIIGSSAEELTLSVSYFVKAPGENDYIKVNTITSNGYQEGAPNLIPHDKIEYNIDGRSNSVTYYVPYVREMFGPNFASVIEGSKQKMEIVTYDRSNNASDVQTIYFKTTFDLPTFLVYTPFMNANVELRGMNSEGMFDPNAIDNCVTMQVEEQLDVASCQLRADLLDYKFLQIKLSNPGSGKAFYYQWHDDESFLREIDLNQGGFWAYFSATNTNDFYITELSAYHTGLFDFLWGQEENRTHETALANLQQVNTALSDKTSNSFFKFNPVTTRYATNIDLVSIPTVPGDEYVHRFFVESLYKLATTADATSTSVDFASAFYQDFVFDGKANGVGQNGAIKVGSNYFVTSVTYRESIASTFNELLTEKYFVSPQIALSLSDIFALANPSLSIGNLVHLVFDTAGNSIDDDPPSVLVKPSENQAAGGTFYKTTGDIYYIAGQVNFEASIADPSGIQGEPDINAYWYERNGDIPQPVEMHFNPSDDVYNKQYAFAFDSKDPRFENIFQFALNVIASDNKLNAYTAENPHITTFNVDNDYPAVTYRAPSDQSQETYLNVNRERILTFYIDDEIGDV